MKSYCLLLLLCVLVFSSVSAFAGMWSLVKSDFVGNGWMCTYRLDGTNYIATIFSSSFCKSFVYQ